MLLLFALPLSAQSMKVAGPTKIVGPAKTTGGSVSVTLDAHCASAVTIGSSASCNLTISASAKVACVGTAVASVSGIVNSVTIGASNATQVVTPQSSTQESGEVWCLASPPSGTQTVTVSWNVTGANAMAASSVVGGSGAVTAFTSTTGTSSPASITGSSSGGHLVVDFMVQDQGTCSSTTATPTGTGQTQIDNTCSDSDLRLATSQTVGAASVTPTWTLAASPTWLEVAIDVH